MRANKELSILKWVGVVLACLSTFFTLAIVGSHLSGRLVGLGRVGILGTIGAELMAISCAWLVASERKRVASVAMICQVILTGTLLVNASIALDLDWQETLAGRAAERQLIVAKQAAEEKRKTLEKQAELALQLLEKDKRLARAFVRTENPMDVEGAEIQRTARPILTLLDAQRLNIYERYGLTVMPLFLALLTVIALAIAAQSGGDGPQRNELPAKPELTASVESPLTAAAIDGETHLRKTEDEAAEVISESLLPSGDDKKRSATVGRYQFRKDGVGWQCREIIGKGANQKRSYVAYLSRAAYEKIQVSAASREEMEERLVEWADKKREAKYQRSLPFQPVAEQSTGTTQKSLPFQNLSLILNPANDRKSRKTGLLDLGSREVYSDEERRTSRDAETRGGEVRRL